MKIGQPKLTAEQVREIREAVRQRRQLTNKLLARKYGVERWAISRIASGKSWRELG